MNERLEYIQDLNKEILRKLTNSYKNINNKNNNKNFVCPYLPSHNISNCNNKRFYNGENEAIEYSLNLLESNQYKYKLKYPKSAYKKNQNNELPKNNTNLYKIPLIPDNQYNCHQCIIGTFEHTCHYILYNKNVKKIFNISVAKNWSQVLNEKYIDCIINLAFSGLKDPSCKYPIRLILPKNLTKINKDNKVTTRITYLELCIILKNLRYKNKENKKVFISHKLKKEEMIKYMPNVNDVDIYFLEVNKENLNQ